MPLVTFPLSKNDVGPVAFSTKSVSTALPPLSLITIFSSVSDGISSSLVIPHVADSPNPKVMDVPFWVPSPVHTQSLAVYPAGPDSLRV